MKWKAYRFPDELSGVRKLMDTLEMFYLTVYLESKDGEVAKINQKSRPFYNGTNLPPNKKAYKNLRNIDQMCDELAEEILNWYII